MIDPKLFGPSTASITKSDVMIAKFLVRCRWMLFEKEQPILIHFIPVSFKMPINRWKTNFRQNKWGLIDCIDKNGNWMIKKKKIKQPKMDKLNQTTASEVRSQRICCCIPMKFYWNTTNIFSYKNYVAQKNHIWRIYNPKLSLLTNSNNRFCLGSAIKN